MSALRIVFLVLALGVLGLLGWRAAAWRSAPAVLEARPAATPYAALDSAMRVGAITAPLPALPSTSAPPSPDLTGDEPEFASFYGRLKSDFPHDYASVLDGLARRGSPLPPGAAIWDALRELEQSQGILIAQAGPAALDRFFDARSAMLAGLASGDAQRCVDFLYGLTDASIAQFTATHRALVAALADRTLDAIADGRSSPVDRVAPTDADLDAVGAGLAAFGLTSPEVGLLVDGTTPDPPPPDARLCEIGRTYLDVLHGLPADARGRIYGLAAQLLARS